MTKIRRHLKFEFILALFLVVAIFIPYGQILNHEFISFDDNLYVTENSHVKNGLTKNGVTWAFDYKHKYNTYWHPLTWLSHMSDSQLFGLNPRMHHLTNLIFHIANALMLFVVFRRMTGFLWRSIFIAALFALHPIGVDSVAWIAERKSILSTFFWCLTMIMYAYYIRSPNLYKYLLVFLFFSLGLMAKPSIATLPLILLLLDYWPFKRFRLNNFRYDGAKNHFKAENSVYRKYSITHLISEKIPLLLISGVAVYLSSLSLQYSEIMISSDSVPIKLRVANALVSYIGYIGKTIWPQNLAVYYPYPIDVPIWQAIGASLILLIISIFVILKLKSMPYLTVGWLWYLITLIPFSGLMQAGLWPAMADRWAYVPLIGIFIMIAWGIPELLVRWRHKRVMLAISSGLILFLFMICSWFQTRHWKDSISLFTHAIKVTHDNFIAHTALATHLAGQGKLDDAMRHYSKSLQIKPDFAETHYNMAYCLEQKGIMSQALNHYYEALRINPKHSMAHNNLGNALMQLGDLDEAIGHFNKALLINPKSSKAHNNLGNAMVKKGNIEKAMIHYAEALKIDPGYAMAHMNLGSTLAQQRKFEEAIFHFSEALRIEPNSAEAHFNLGIALEIQGRLDEAVDHYTDAVRIKPEYAEAHGNLGGAQLRKGNIREAIRHFSEALRFNSENAKLNYNLGAAFAMKGDFQQAAEHFREALRLKPDYTKAREALERISQLIKQSGAK